MKLLHTWGQEFDIQQSKTFRIENRLNLVCFINIAAIDQTQGPEVLIFFIDQYRFFRKLAQEKPGTLFVERFHRKADPGFISKWPSAGWTKSSTIAAFIAKIADVQDLEWLVNPELLIGFDSDVPILFQNRLLQ